MSETPIFVISDLHIGDGGPRDNFAYGDRPKQFEMFLDTVARENGELIILGDLFDFWQASLSRLIINSLPLLDRFTRLNATYVLGNHDVDLLHFIGKNFLGHPFFEHMTGPIIRDIAGRKFKFMHGHEVDPANAGDTPGIGRVATILGGIGEDLVGAPFLPDGKSVETVLMGWVNLALWVWRFFVNWCKRKITGGRVPDPRSQLTPQQNPDRETEMIGKYAANLRDEGYQVAIVGHTHNPGWIGEWYFNTGSWATTNNNVVRITRKGEVTVCKAKDGRLIPLSVNPLKDAKVPGA